MSKINFPEHDRHDETPENVCGAKVLVRYAKKMESYQFVVG